MLKEDLALARVNVSELVQDLRVLRPALQDDVLFVKEPLHPVVANRTLLQQCLSNLLDNSLKFMAPGTKPRIVFGPKKIHVSERQILEMQPAAQRSTVAALPPNDLIQTESSLTQAAETERIRIWIEDNGIGSPRKCGIRSLEFLSV